MDSTEPGVQDAVELGYSEHVTKEEAEFISKLEDVAAFAKDNGFTVALSYLSPINEDNRANHGALVVGELDDLFHCVLMMLDNNLWHEYGVDMKSTVYQYWDREGVIEVIKNNIEECNFTLTEVNN